MISTLSPFGFADSISVRFTSSKRVVDDIERPRQVLDDGVEAITDFEEPPAPFFGDKSFDDIPMNLVAGTLVTIVDEAGPIADETAFKATINCWSISRLGRNIRRQLDGITRQLDRKELVRHDGVLWPSDRPETIMIRKNTDRARRDIDEIPLREIAKATYLILENGGAMHRDDLILETTRLFGYQRRGESIEARIGRAVDMLEDLGLVEGGEKIHSTTGDVDEVLLESVY